MNSSREPAEGSCRAYTLILVPHTPLGLLNFKTATEAEYSGSHV
jgi:hypothetical protein